MTMRFLILGILTVSLAPALDWYTTHVEAGREPSGRIAWGEITVENPSTVNREFTVEAWRHDGREPVDVTDTQFVEAGKTVKLRVESVRLPAQSWVHLAGDSVLHVSVVQQSLVGDTLTTYPRFTLTNRHFFGRYAVKASGMFALNPTPTVQKLQLCGGVLVMRCWAYTVQPHAVWHFRPERRSGVIIAPAMLVGNMSGGIAGSTSHYDVDSSVKFGEVK